MNFGSFRLNGKLKIVDGTTNNRPLDPRDIKLSGKAGVHSVIEGITTELENGGVIENIGSSYPRMVCMYGASSLSGGDYCMASKVSEGRTNADEANRSISYGQNITPAGKNAVFKDFEFSIKPMICLNQNSGASSVSYNKSGSVRVSFNLAKNIHALHGHDTGTLNAGNYTNNGSSYELSDLKVSFNSVPDDGQQDPINLKVSQIVKQVLSSQSANVSSKVPLVCSGVSCSFISQASENSFNVDTNELQRPSNVRNVQFLFNNASNQYVSYSLDREEQILDYGIKSLANTGHHQVNKETLKANDGYILGVSFDSLVDLTNQNFNITLGSDITNANPFTFIQVFHGEINL